MRVAIKRSFDFQKMSVRPCGTCRGSSAGLPDFRHYAAATRLANDRSGPTGSGLRLRKRMTDAAEVDVHQAGTGLRASITAQPRFADWFGH
jgi:hypothetical protein